MTIASNSLRGQITEIAEAAGASFPAFVQILGGVKKGLKVVQPRDWRNELGIPGNPSTDDWKKHSIRFARKHYGYDGMDDNVSDAICIAHHLHMENERKRLAFEAAKRAKVA